MPFYVTLYYTYLFTLHFLVILVFRKTKMSKNDISFFDEKRSVIKTRTDWGFWWQTVQEVHIQVEIPKLTSAKEIKVNVRPKYIQCIVHGKTIFEVNT